jgi:hypothetical protein
MIQVVASVVVMVLGLVLALLVDIPGDMRLFAWILVALGAFGLVSRWMISRQRDDRNAPGRRR